MNSDLRERPKDTYSVIWNAVWNAAGLDDGECESITQAVLTAMGDLITLQELDEAVAKAVAGEREACLNAVEECAYTPDNDIEEAFVDGVSASEEAIRARSEQKEGE